MQGKFLRELGLKHREQTDQMTAVLVFLMVLKPNSPFFSVIATT